MPPKPAPVPTRPDAKLALAQQQQYVQGIAELELPKTTLVKLAKGSIPDNVKMQQDVVHALMRSSTLFISYLTAAAHDQATARSGKQITAGDVIKAITDLDFGPADALVPLLEQELAAFRANVAASKAAKVKPPGPGRGRRRQSAPGEESMVVDDDEEGEGDGDEQEEHGDEADAGDDDDDEDDVEGQVDAGHAE